MNRIPEFVSKTCNSVVSKVISSYSRMYCAVRFKTSPLHFE